MRGYFKTAFDIWGLITMPVFIYVGSLSFPVCSLLCGLYQGMGKLKKVCRKLCPQNILNKLGHFKYDKINWQNFMPFVLNTRTIKDGT
jgi:hypothetical protein